MLTIATEVSDPLKDDLTLTAAAAAGDQGARRQLVSRLMERARTTVRYLCGDHMDGDDFVQLSLLQVLKSAAGYEGRSSLEAWADRIVVRTTMRNLRRGRARGESTRLGRQAEPVPAHEAMNENARQLERRQLARVMSRLTEDRRTVLVLKLVHGYSIDEIAKMTGARHNTVRDRLARGRKQLKTMLEKDPVFGDRTRA